MVSRKFQEFYLRNRELLPEKVHFIPNWIDENELVVNPTDNPIRAQYQIPEDAFLVVYGGNVGVAAGVESLVQAFTDLLDCEDIYLLIAGGGSNFNQCQSLARSAGNRRILFHSPLLLEENSIVFGAADLCILPTQGKQSLVSVPSKLLSYMLASRPVVAMALPDSEVAKTVLESGCGWVIPPEDPQNLAKLIIEISKLPKSERIRRGKVGRDFAPKHYSKAVNLQKVIAILESVGC